MNSIVDFKSLKMGFASLTLATTLTLGGFVPAAIAEDEQSKDEKALEILSGMSTYLGGQTNVSFVAESLFDIVSEGGIKAKIGVRHNVAMKRPSHLLVQSQFENGATARASFDGETFVLYRSLDNGLSKIRAPGTIDQLLDLLTKDFQLNMPLADVLYSDLDKTFSEHIITAEYLGERTIQGVTCHHLLVESTGADWQIWIEADDTPVPRRLAILAVEEKGQPEILARFTDWQFGDAAMTDLTFAAPDGAVDKELQKAN